MSTFAASLGDIKKPWQWMAIGGGILLIWGAVAFPVMHQASPEPASRITYAEPVAQFQEAAPAKAAPVAGALEQDAMRARASDSPAAADIAGGRKIIRTSSMEMVVQHPAEVADKITMLAEGLGGYLVSADGGGQNATAGMLTIRIPAARFEEARAESASWACGLRARRSMRRMSPGSTSIRTRTSAICARRRQDISRS